METIDAELAEGSSETIQGRVLIVDDEPAVREVCAECLSKHGYSVGTTGEPQKVLHMIRQEEWDLVLTDITMPEMTGIDLLKEIRNWDHTFPVILFTGYGTYDRALHALRLGADDFLTKPVRMDALRRSVDSVLAKRLHRKEQERRKALERLLQMGADLAGKIDEDAIFDLLQNAVQAETGAERVSILRPVGDQQLRVIHSTGGPPGAEDMRVPLATSPTRLVFDTGLPLRVNDIRNDPRFAALPDRYRTGSFMCLPLVMSDRVAEVLTITDKKDGTPFNLADEQSVKALALHGAVALERARLFRELQLKIDETQELFYGTIHAISNSLDAKSAWTKGHSERVMTYSIMIGKELGMHRDDLDNLELAALLHDVGKIGTYDALLEKPGALTDDEYVQMKEHPAKGAEILSPLQKLAPILPAIRNHHERYDGGGYPDALAGQDIPFLARILTVADTYDSMTSQRPYRKTPGKQQAFAELQELSGVQFDPMIVEAFLNTLHYS